MQVILAGHGKLGPALKYSSEMIFGEISHFQVVAFEKGESMYDVLDKYKEIVANKVEEEYLIATDIFGGSPYNAASALAMENAKVEVLTGVSLPMCLELATLENSAVKDVVEQMKTDSSTFVKSFRDQIIEEEEDL